MCHQLTSEEHARGRERERHRKGDDSRAQRAHTTVAFSGRRTSGREQQTGSACRTAGGVRVAAEAEQKSKRSTHTVNTIEECQWELVLSAPLCNSLIHFVVVAVPLVCCTWRRNRNRNNKTPANPNTIQELNTELNRVPVGRQLSSRPASRSVYIEKLQNLRIWSTLQSLKWLKSLSAIPESYTLSN